MRLTAADHHTLLTCTRDDTLRSLDLRMNKVVKTFWFVLTLSSSLMLTTTGGHRTQQSYLCVMEAVCVAIEPDYINFIKTEKSLYS